MYFGNDMPTEKGCYFFGFLAVVGLLSIIGGIIALCVWAFRHIAIV